MSGSFQAYNGEGSKEITWYKRGEVKFKVTKKVKISAHSSRIVLEDRIVKKSNEKLAADWGYHIQLRPTEGAEYLVPSKYMRDYGGAEIKSNSEI